MTIIGIIGFGILSTKKMDNYNKDRQKPMIPIYSPRRSVLS